MIVEYQLLFFYLILSYDLPKKSLTPKSLNVSYQKRNIAIAATVIAYGVHKPYFLPTIKRHLCPIVVSAAIYLPTHLHNNVLGFDSLCSTRHRVFRYLKR